MPAVLDADAAQQVTATLQYPDSRVMPVFCIDYNNMCNKLSTTPTEVTRFVDIHALPYTELFTCAKQQRN